ncbi:DUF6732 family protein [Jannaschia pohangensis]|uniref:LPXTG-motif cell wall anchor domain-containing protein n=1 Tax=Jannaschia pohangensis TaxID=390807 RepID=A0A1I3Q9B5_9RHOB|nr:DUF6732 family protein [Jannaschia pohangensis]SFJ30209.1 hypothetical protein SAMN04488095_2455 [Jannaschia pohangensis]
MRCLLLLPALISTPAMAHVGHLGQVAGHDHWTIGVGLGVIAGAAVIGALKGRRKKDAAPEADKTDEQEQSA